MLLCCTRNASQIDKAERVKAYLYGDRKVPFPEVEECVASKFNVAMDKGMKVLCFTPKERVRVLSNVSSCFSLVRAHGTCAGAAQSAHG